MKKFVIIFLTSLLLAVGCNINDISFEDIQLPNYRGVVALPLGEVTYTLPQIFDELDFNSSELLVDEATGLYSLVYFDTIIYSDNDFISIDDVINLRKIPLPVTSTVGTYPINIAPIVLNYDAQGEEVINRVLYNNGELRATMQLSGQGTLNYQLVFDNTLQTSNEQTVQFDGANVTNTSAGIHAQALNGFESRLTRVGSRNTFTVRLQNLTLTLADGESTSSADSITLEVGYYNQGFEAIFGRFGNKNIPIGNQTINTSIFRELGKNGALLFENPQLKFTVKNFIGVPLGLNFRDISSERFDSTSGNTIVERLTGSAIGTPQRVNAPTVAQFGQSVETSITLERRNANLQNLFRNSPDRIVLDINAVSNPTGTNQENFLNLANNRVETYVEVRIPMAMQLRNIRRDFELPLPDNLEIKDADSVSLRIATENLLPFSTFIRLAIPQKDAADTFVIPARNLPAIQVMNTPFLNADRIANEAQKFVNNVVLGPDDIAKLENGEKIIVEITLNTPVSLNSNEIFPKFLERYSLTVKLSVAARLNRPLGKQND